MRVRRPFTAASRAGSRVPRSFFLQPTVKAARQVLGMRLVKMERGRRMSGIIVEAEAYVGREDLGCHASRGGLTPRNAVLFGPPGHAYVYFTYGMHWLLNFVTEADEFPAAVLVRAMIPAEGRAAMVRRRGGHRPVAGGPAMICQALALDDRWNGHDLCEKESHLFLERAFTFPDNAVTLGPRVGLYSVPEPWKSIPWRFRAAAEIEQALEQKLKSTAR